MKRIIYKDLADLMVASPYSQHNISQSYKYPAEDESKVKILYYIDAKSWTNETMVLTVSNPKEM